MSERETWLNQRIEEAINPTLSIIDAHHHLWKTPPREGLDPYFYEAFFSDKCTSGHKIVASVYVDSLSNYHKNGPEHLRVVGETAFAEWVAKLADKRGGCSAGACAAIVANADLMLGTKVGEVLDAHLAASPRLRGVRCMTISDPDVPGSREPGMMSRKAFREGFAELAARQLSFDACVFQGQLRELAELCEAFPETPIVLNHLGTPLAVGRYASHPAEARNEWKAGMMTLAQLPNVFVKIGGMNMSFTGLGVDEGAAAPAGSNELAERQRMHVLTTIELFGPERCMFESNFPVDGRVVSYTVLWNTFKRITSDFSATERSDLFAGTAQRIYRITLPQPLVP